MSVPVFADLLENLRADPAAHNLWKRLADYPSNNTAKMTASRLRKKWEPEGFAFKVVVGSGRLAGRFVIGVMFKQTDGDGRIPQ